MHFIHRLLALWLLALCCSIVGAQNISPSVPLETLRAQLNAIPTALDNGTDIRTLTANIHDIQGQAESIAATRKAQLAELDARLAELGTAPSKGAGAEAQDLTQHRTSLQKDRNTLDNELKLARLIAIDAQQRETDLIAQRRTRLQAQLSEQTDSLLQAEFWRNLQAALPADQARLNQLASTLQSQLTGTPRWQAPLTFAIALFLFVTLLGNWLAERALVRIMPGKLPTGRLRRSLLAVASVVANVLITGMAIQLAFNILQSPDGQTTDRREEIIRVTTHLCMFAAFFVGLGRALLSNQRPSWRLPPISDALARRLRFFPWLTALTIILVGLLQKTSSASNISLATDISIHVIATLALSGLVAALLLCLRASRNTPQPDNNAPQAPDWLMLAASILWLLLVAIWLLLAAGYVTLAQFAAFQLVWSGIVTATFYLLFKFADDLFITMLSSHSRFGQRMQSALHASPHLLNQAAVLLSGLSRLALFFFMVISLLAPFGTTPGELFQRSGRFGAGFQIGEIQLVPRAIFSALAVAFIGFLALHVFKRWLMRKYLPSTALEPGMRISVTTLSGYAGSIAVVALALSALGISVERIAWVASALSVGIGFGLQAIVQNFISGLILLAERPVKVGDWVVLGTTEGDVKRINVRATEIQLGDRSILIVPNSEFITKAVRNMTLANAEGRVLIHLPMPLSTDASKVREIIQTIFHRHPTVLDSPAPSVQLDSIENGTMVFLATAYVPNPRLVSTIRSDLLFSILDHLKAANLPLTSNALTVTSGEPLIVTQAAVAPPPACSP